MGARAEQLARKLDESCAEFNKVVETLSDADRKKVTSAEKLGSIRAITRVNKRPRAPCARASRCRALTRRWI